MKAYLRLVARWLIEDDENDERDAIWEQMNPEERKATNTIVEAIFGEWL